MDTQFTILMTHDHNGDEARPGAQSDESLIADANHIVHDNIPAGFAGTVSFSIDGPRSTITFSGHQVVMDHLFRELDSVPDLRVIDQPHPVREIPNKADWEAADEAARDLTALIMRLPLNEQNIKATLTAFFANESAERRDFARRAFTSPR